MGRIVPLLCDRASVRRRNRVLRQRRICRHSDQHHDVPTFRRSVSLSELESRLKYYEEKQYGDYLTNVMVPLYLEPTELCGLNVVFCV
jgi:hypothetical protein